MLWYNRPGPKDQWYMSDKYSKNKWKFKDINKQNKVNCLENDIKLD